MQWDGDEYRDLKWLIFDVVRSELPLSDCENISIARLSGLIDKFINELLKEDV